MNDHVDPSSVNTADLFNDAAQTTVAPEPAKRSRKVLWISLAAASSLVVAGAVTASLILIAPGTKVAGADVSWQTGGFAADSIDKQLDNIQLTVSNGEQSEVFTARELGAQFDSEQLAAQIHNEYPLWNISKWFAEPVSVELVFDDAQTAAILEQKLPQSHVAAQDAQLVFDDSEKKYVVVDAVPGTGIDYVAVQQAVLTSINENDPEHSVDAEIVEIDPAIGTDTAAAFSEDLNEKLAVAGFYVGDERTVALAPEVVADWITITPEDQTFVVDVDEAKIAAATTELATKVNRAPKNGKTLVDSSGKVIDDSDAGLSGRTLKNVDSVAANFAANLKNGDTTVKLEVDEVAAQNTKVTRLLEVDLKKQRMWMKENGAVVDTWLISSGTANTPTHPGNFKIGWKTPKQTMSGIETINGKPVLDDNGDPVRYRTENVKWAMYFNGDQAFHGVYWHNNWGSQMSHGCVGMPEYRAEQIYNWAPEGVEVKIY